MHDSPPCVLDFQGEPTAKMGPGPAAHRKRAAPHPGNDRGNDRGHARPPRSIVSICELVSCPGRVAARQRCCAEPGPTFISQRWPPISSAPRCAISGERGAVIARSTSCDEAIQPFGRGLWIASELALLAMTRDEAIALHSKVLRYLRPKQHEVGHIQPAQNAVDDCPEYRMLLV